MKKHQLKEIKKIVRVLNTIKHVTPVQLLYLIKYKVFSGKSSIDYKSNYEKDVQNISTLPIIEERTIIQIVNGSIKVRLLNLERTYYKTIVWNENTNGRLWNYNLRYADFLKQKNIPLEKRESILISLYESLNSGVITPEPYPVSLRAMNSIRFISDNHGKLQSDKYLINSTYSELKFLNDHIEYHISGNHLLENGFALLMGGTFFQSDKWVHKAKRILSKELDRQILPDGAHYERSVMYHKIILFRVLEASYFITDDEVFKKNLLDIASKMVSWLNQMTFQHGKVAHFNDSTNGVALPNEQLLNFSEVCGVDKSKQLKMCESGYRRIENDGFTLICDVEGIKPTHQPGHAHADSLSFVLAFNGVPFLVDPSVSTYDNLEVRGWEKSTAAHNTVTWNLQNTAEIWGSFRVAKRPQVSITEERNKSIRARLICKLNLFKSFIHSRCWTFTNGVLYIKDEVNIQDFVQGHLYLDPAVKIDKSAGNRVVLSNSVVIEFNDVEKIETNSYLFSEEFNKRTRALRINYTFKKSCELHIYEDKVG